MASKTVKKQNKQKKGLGNNRIWVLMGLAVFVWLFTFIFAILDSAIWENPQGDFTISTTLKTMSHKWVPAVTLTIWACVTLRILQATGLIMDTAAWWIVYPLLFWCSVAFILLGFVYTTEISYVGHAILSLSVLLSICTIVTLTFIEYRKQDRQIMDGSMITIISVMVIAFLAIVVFSVSGALLLHEEETKGEFLMLVIGEYSFVVAVLIWTVAISNIAFKHQKKTGNKDFM